MEKKDIILEELAQGSEPSTVSPEVLALNDFRLTSKTVIAEEDFLFRHLGKPCFPRRELTTITGAAKSGKTYFTSMVMACCAKREVMAMERIGEAPLRVMWYDTEQSRNTTKEILVGRIGRMIEDGEARAFPDDQFFVFNTRTATVKERRDLLGVAIDTYRPDIVILDGVADLLTDINDGPKSLDLLDYLQLLADGYNCNITTVIHLNRTGEKSNLRGWLGSVLMQKSFEVFNCSASAQGDMLCVELNISRKYRNNRKLYYRVGDNGIPVIMERHQQTAGSQQPTTDGSKATASEDALNQDYIISHDANSWEWDLKRLFTDAMGDLPSMGSDQLMEAVMKLSHIKHSQYYHRLLFEAVRRGYVTKTTDRYKRVAFVLPPPSTPSPSAPPSVYAPPPS